MMTNALRATTWHGTQQEQYELLRATAHNCHCQVAFGTVLSSCAAHAMLATDQRAVDGLIWERRIARIRMVEEFTLAPKMANARREAGW